MCSSHSTYILILYLLTIYVGCACIAEQKNVCLLDLLRKKRWLDEDLYLEFLPTFRVFVNDLSDLSIAVKNVSF